MKNSPFANIPFTRNDAVVIAIERAFSDMRRGVPVVLLNQAGQAVLAVAVEAIGQEELERLERVNNGKLSLLLTAKRARHVFPDAKFTEHMQAEKAGWTLPELQALGGMHKLQEERAQAADFFPAGALACAALALVKLAELLPVVLLVALEGPAQHFLDAVHYAAENGLLVVKAEEVAQYKEKIATGMKEVCRAPLRLENAEKAAIVAFRTLGSSREHYALIIGEPDMANPLVRVHSSCYTGDLLGSLHCDCGDQLRTAIASMATGQGGIILYLMQEGRGIGLTNKLRTYGLQAEGMDTVDANETLGFDDDERLFLPAAKMLEALNIARVKLLSNNPRKAKGLEECGIVVSECVPHIMTAHQHNETYLRTKANRLGHKLPSK